MLENGGATEGLHSSQGRDLTCGSIRVHFVPLQSIFSFLAIIVEMTCKVATHLTCELLNCPMLAMVLLLKACVELCTGISR